MKLNSTAVRVAMARTVANANDLAKRYGCSSQRIRVILNSNNITEKTAGKLAKALNVDVSEIIEA